MDYEYNKSYQEGYSQGRNGITKGVTPPDWISFIKGYSDGESDKALFERFALKETVYD